MLKIFQVIAILEVRIKAGVLHANSGMEGMSTLCAYAYGSQSQTWDATYM